MVTGHFDVCWHEYRAFIVIVVFPQRGKTEKCGQANQPVSTGQLNALLRLHHPPINLVVYQGLDGDAESWSWLPA